MADRNIKGITVEIGGDTTGLDKALKDTETNSKKAASELRSIDRALKDAPQNAVLWQQKQVVLNKALEESKKKLKVLEDAQEQVNKQFEKGDITAEQYRAFQREVEKSKSEVGRLESQVESVNQEVENLGRVSDDAAEEVQELGESADDTAYEVKQLGESAEDAGNKAENSSDGFTVMKGAVANLVSEGISKAVEGFKELATEGDAAINTLQTRTGATAEQMEEYKDIIDSLYADNMGEDRIDIADSIAEVKQQLGDIDASSLEEVTNTALLMRDTFDFEVNESVRAVNMLMKQFGITADEAYTLIAQGAQNGLNKNGDLLDVINEYGVHYNQLGYSAEEFFNSLQNGTESGTFSVDKLGDAMKEFGIRVRDTTDSTTEGFTLIGLNADIMRSRFAKGGESAKEAAQQTVNALFSVDDKIVQNQAGVALFGTMWEDMGADAVKALMDTNGEADKTKSTLQDIAEVKYDDLGSQFQQVGRQAKTEILEPIAEDFLPEIKKAVDWVAKNLPEILKTGKQMLPVIKAAGVGFATWKIAGLAKDGTSAVKDLISKIKDLGKGSISTGTAVQGTLAATTAAVIFASEAYEKWYQNQHAAMIEADKYKKSVEESSAQLNDLEESAYQSASAELEQIDKTKALWKELQNLSDASGNVKAKDQERAEYIIGELEQATGIEIGYIDGQIQKYQELTGEIDKVIEKKKAETLINSFDGVYTEARAQAGQAQSEYYEAKKKYDALKVADDAANSGKMFNGGIGSQQYSEETRAAEIEMNAAKEKYLNATDELSAYTRAEEAYEQGHYDMVESILYSDLDANAKTVRDFNKSTQEREESFRDMCDSMLSNLKLANSAQSKEMQQSTANIMTELVSAYTDGGLTSGVNFSTEFRNELQKALDAGISFDSFIEAAGDAGWNIGEILGSEAAARYQEIISERMTLHTQQLYANNNLIPKTINSQSDANLYRDSKYGTPKMATGGILNYGKAIVAEAGPELLQLTNQGVQVTPLTQTARNHALSSISGGGDTYNQHITVNVQKISSDYDVRRIAQQMANELKRTRRGGGE